MKLVSKTITVCLLSMALAAGLTAFGQSSAPTNPFQTTNYGGSRPMDSGIQPTRPNQGGTAWMSSITNSESSNVVATVTGPASNADMKESMSTILKNCSWLGIVGLVGLFSLVRRQTEAAT